MLVLITGATGTLGTELVPRLRDAGHEVRVMSRRPLTAPASVVADLGNGTGLAQAVQGVDAIVHAASATTHFWQYEAVDVRGTSRLLDLAREHGVRHFLYPSIVHMDGIPYPYYRVKLKVEEAVRESGIPWTILRTTQFHALTDLLIRAGSKGPVALVPAGWQFQPVDPSDVAQDITQLIGAKPARMIPEWGGPEVRTIEDLTVAWLRARGSRKRVVRVQIPGRISRAVRRGQLTCPDHLEGHVRWEEWLEQRYQSAGH